MFATINACFNLSSPKCVSKFTCSNGYSLLPLVDDIHVSVHGFIISLWHSFSKKTLLIMDLEVPVFQIVEKFLFVDCCLEISDLPLFK